MSNTAKKTQREADAFEDRIRRLLAKMELSHVDGGPNVVLGHQIDAIGAIDDTLLVLDCTISEGRKAKRLGPKINSFRGTTDRIEQSIRAHETYRQYDQLAFILVANANVSETDIENGRKGTPPIHVVDRQKLEYLETIARDLDRYAKYRFAKLLGLSIKRTTSGVPAVRLMDGKKPLYVFCATANDLAELAFVPQTEVGMKLFYQRMMRKSKIEDIGDYVLENRRPFPNSVVLSMDLEPAFRPSSDEGSADIAAYPDLTLGVLELPNEYGCCWVVDGQHRIFGSALARPEQMLPVTLVPATPIEKARYFLDINSTQTKIDPNLLWDLTGILSRDEPDGRLSRSCQLLDQLDNPFKGRVKIPRLGDLKSRDISLAGLCVSVKRSGLLTEAPFRPEDEAVVRNLSQTLSEFLNEIDGAVANEDAKENLVFKDGGFAILMTILKRILKITEKRPTSDQLKEFSLAFSKWTDSLGPGVPKALARRSSSASRLQLAEEAIVEMNLHLPPSKQLLTKGPSSRLNDDVVKLEADARTRIDTILTDAIGSEWLKKANLQGRSGPLTSADQMTIGHVLDVIKRADFWRYFVGGFGRSNINREMAQSMLEYVVQFRNDSLHGHYERLRTYNKKLLETYIETIRKCLQG